MGSHVLEESLLMRATVTVTEFSQFQNDLRGREGGREGRREGGREGGREGYRAEEEREGVKEG